jgi:hypothetical protein
MFSAPRTHQSITSSFPPELSANHPRHRPSEPAVAIETRTFGQGTWCVALSAAPSRVMSLCERCRFVPQGADTVQQAIHSVIQRSNNLIRYTVNIQKVFGRVHRLACST